MVNDRHLRLKLLRSLPPLLDSTLPSPPPSPSTSSSSKLNSNSTRRSGVDEKPIISGSREFKEVKPIKTESSHGSNVGSSSMMSRGSQGGSYIGKLEDWRISYPKERLKKIATLYRTKGRELKHAGDRSARSSGSSTVLSILQQTEAILFYIFSFWCDDQANNKVCQAFNWQSIFALITFVRKAAEGLGGLEVVIGICLRMEAYAVQTLSTHEQKTLSYQAGKILPTASSSQTTLPANSPPLPQLSPSTSSASSTALIPSLSLPIPPLTGPSSSKQPPTAIELLKSYHKASIEIFRYQRLFEDSSLLLSTSSLSSYLSTSASMDSIPSTMEIDKLGPALMIQSSEWRIENGLIQIGLIERNWMNFNNGCEILRSVTGAREVLLSVAKERGIKEFREGVVIED